MMIAGLITAYLLQSASGATGWPLWAAYREEVISDDGRVIDRSAGDRTTSEGQAYAMFFALVAGDRATFDTLLGWTVDNLAKGDLTRELPAWLWGRADDGAWRVLDTNSASDADLWIAYTLLQAARRFEAPHLGRLGRSVLTNIAEREVVELPGLGRMLLPGLRGFVLSPARWRLNPSYLPVPVLRGLAGADPRGPWAELAKNATKLVEATSRDGFVPDWVIYDASLGFLEDEISAGAGSYDAIRNYLWAAAISPRSPERTALIAHLGGPLAVHRALGAVPERVIVSSGTVESLDAPPGFVAVALALAVSTGDASAAITLTAELERRRSGLLYGEPPKYYDQNLALFARGLLDGYYWFDESGALRTKLPVSPLPSASPSSARALRARR